MIFLNRIKTNLMHARLIQRRRGWWFVTSIFVVLVALNSASTAIAHGDSHSTIKIIRTTAGNWAFELQAPLAKLDNAMLLSSEPPSTEYESGSIRHKELLVQYIKQTFDLKVPNATEVPELGKGRLRLGHHVSVFQFEIKHLPDAPEQLQVSLPFMGDLAGQQNVLYLIDGERKERFVLSAGNKFSLAQTDFFKQAHSEARPHGHSDARSTGADGSVHSHSHAHETLQAKATLISR